MERGGGEEAPRGFQIGNLKAVAFYTYELKLCSFVLRSLEGPKMSLGSNPKKRNRKDVRQSLSLADRG